MINVSKEFLQLMGERTDFKENAEITFSDGTVLNLSEKDFTITNNSVTDAADTNSFPLGVAISRNIQIELMNDDEHLSEYDFFGAKIRLYLTYQLSRTVEKIEYGTFTVLSPETYGTTVAITANDDMYKADKPYSTTLSFPASAGAVLGDICSNCDIPLLSTSFLHDDLIIEAIPSSDYTFREIIGYIAMIAVGNARINRQGYLEILSYAFDFDSRPYHTLNAWKNLKLDTSNITITGIQTVCTKEIIETDEDGNETSKSEDVTVSDGEEGYVLSIENPLIAGQEQEIVELIGNVLIGTSFRKFEGDCVGYPIAEFMDLVKVVDRKGNEYNSFLTDINFVFFGFTTMKNSAESALRNSSKYVSNETKAIIAARKLVEKEKSDRELAVGNLAKALSESSGMYITIEEQPDGSNVYYMHNKPSLAESDIVWKLTAEAFGISTDGGETYPYGFTVTGEMITRLLHTVGVNADWINTGSLTARDADGNVVFSVNVETGEVAISASSIRMSSSKTVEETISNIEGKKMYRTELVVEGTSIFRDKGQMSRLSCRVLSWDKDITATLPDSAFEWHRKSGNAETDADWDGLHKGMKSVTISTEDVCDNASFYCEVNI